MVNLTKGTFCIVFYIASMESFILTDQIHVTKIAIFRCCQVNIPNSSFSNNEATL